MELIEIRAETAGSILKILVAPDDQVEVEDVVMILESMKMEIPIVAPCAGRVTEILVAEGTSVSGNQLIAILARVERDVR
jgi:acetyl-CoA carboxylase biotin carboxyl carrier protein